MTIKTMFTRRWILTTILVLAGSALCVRLGIWQLDRLEQRRAFNAHVEAQWASPAVNLNAEVPRDVISMEYRSVQVSGSYDYEHQVALRNQYWQDQYGYHLLTPLLLKDGTAVLIDRGWIPGEDGEDPENWGSFNEDTEVVLSGIIRLGGEEPDVGGVPDETGTLQFWNNVNLERIDEQLLYDLLPIYIQLDVDENDTQPPIPYQPEIELTEGPHLGYAGQWFIFASILFFGYPFFLNKQESAKSDE